MGRESENGLKYVKEENETWTEKTKGEKVQEE